jgi:urocanate hydratase
MELNEFQQVITRGIPDVLPATQPYDPDVTHAPVRKDILTREQKKLALRNAIPFWHLNSPTS